MCVCVCLYKFVCVCSSNPCCVQMSSALYLVFNYLYCQYPKCACVHTRQGLLSQSYFPWVLTLNQYWYSLMSAQLPRVWAQSYCEQYKIGCIDTIGCHVRSSAVPTWDRIAIGRAALIKYYMIMRIGACVWLQCMHLHPKVQVSRKRFTLL